MLAHKEFASLIPHQGAMCLWDEVVAWNSDSIQLLTQRHRAEHHPFRSPSGVRAVHLCEYGAQAMAVHGGLRARENGTAAKPGLLVALRAIELHVARIDNLAGALHGEADMLIDGENGWQYAFRIHHDGTLLASGRAAVVHRS